MKFHWSRLLGSSWKLHADKISFKVNMKGQRQASTDKDGFHTGSTRIRTLDQDNHLFWGWRADAFWRWTANPTESTRRTRKILKCGQRWSPHVDGRKDGRKNLRRGLIRDIKFDFLWAITWLQQFICSLRVLKLLIELLFVKYFTDAL